MGIKNIKVLIFSLYLSIGPVVWFPGVNVSLIKLLLLILLIVLSIKYFTPLRIKGILFFSLLFLFLGICLLKNNKGDDCSLLLEGVLENYILFNIGYNLTQDSLFKKKHMVIVISTISFLSLFTITNFIFGIPNWISPIEMKRVDDISYDIGYSVSANMLWSTGFSLSRTGWCNCIMLYLPLCYYLIACKYKPRFVFTCTLFIWASIIIGGSRGAALIAILFTLYYLWKIYHFSSKFIIFTNIVIIVAWIHFSDLSVHFRLNNTDLSTGRIDQYELIPLFLSKMGFWGMGYLKTRDIMYNYMRENLSFHNTYLRILFEYGVTVAFLIVLLVINIYKIFFNIIRDNNNIKHDLSFYMALILICGTLICLNEPGAVFGALSWYSIWWASLGCTLVLIRK